MKCYLRFDADPLSDAQPCRSIAEAVAGFTAVAKPLWNYGQSITASIHVAGTEDTLNEYPDFILSINTNGTTTKEKS